MPVYRASNLAGQVEFVNLDGSARWLGPRIGGHYWPAMHRTADGRWLAAHWTLDGYDGPPGRPMFIEVAAVAAAGWFEAYRLEIPPDLVADLSAPPARPPAAEPGRTAGPSEVSKPAAAGPTEGSNRAGPATWPAPAGAPDREKIVADYLCEHPEATSSEIKRNTGIPEGTIRKLNAWKTHQARRKAGKPDVATDAMRRARPLSEAMLAAVPARSDDPAELAEVHESELIMQRIQADPEYRGIVEREFLETADPSDKAMYHGAEHSERLQMLIAWKLTGMP